MREGSNQWLFVPSLSAPGSEDSTSPCADSEWSAWATSSGTPTLRPSSWPGWRSRPWIALLSGLTSLHSTLERGAAEWISSLPATRASRSAMLASVEVAPTHGTSGRTSRGSSTRPTRGSWSLRTSQDTFAWGSETSSEILPDSGSMRSGVYSARPRQVLLTAASDSSSWPTATSMDSASSGAAAYSTESGRHAGTTLTDAAARSATWSTPLAHAARGRSGSSPSHKGGPCLVQQIQSWPTPRASEREQSNSADSHEALSLRVKSWQTPTTSCASGGQANRGGDRQEELLLAGQARGLLVPETETPGPESSPSTRSSLRLSPRFVEWLMGFPDHWSIASTGSAASATPSSRTRRNSRSSSSPVARSADP